MCKEAFPDLVSLLKLEMIFGRKNICSVSILAPSIIKFNLQMNQRRLSFNGLDFLKSLSSVTLVNRCIEFRKLMIYMGFFMSFDFPSRCSTVDLTHKKKTERVEMMDKNTWVFIFCYLFFL